MGIIKKKTNQYVVSRKAPLEMPPDMYLRPPKVSKEGDSKFISDSENLSLEDILENRVTKKREEGKKKSKNNSARDILVKKILKTKAVTILK